MENVSNFKYLGATLQGDGSSKHDIRVRLTIAKKKLTEFKRLWKGLKTQTKMRILRACIFPIAVYGCEAWTLHESDNKRLKAFEMYCYRSILNITWQQKITNEEVRKRLNITSSHLLGHTIKQKLGYFGHLKRHYSLEKEIMEGKVEGKRDRGRPRRRWKDDIEKWLNLKINEAGRLALDRVAYRQCVWAATFQGASF